MSQGRSLLGRGTWFRPGPATLVVRPAGWMLLVPGARSSLVEFAWSVLGDPGEPDGLLEALAAGSEFGSEDRLPPVLFGLEDAARTTFGVTGTSPLAVYTAEGRSLLAGTDDGPAELTTLEDVRRVAFGDLPAEQPGVALRTVEGMCRVRGFVRMCVDPADLGEQARAALGAQVEEEGRSVQGVEEKARAERTSSAGTAPRSSVTRPESGSLASTAAAVVSDLVAPDRAAPDRAPSMFDDLFAPERTVTASFDLPRTSAGTRPSTGLSPTPGPTAGPVPEPEPTPAPAPESATTPVDGPVPGEEGSAYDELFGRTLHRSIESAAVRAVTEGEDGAATADAASRASRGSRGPGESETDSAPGAPASDTARASEATRDAGSFGREAGTSAASGTGGAPAADAEPSAPGPDGAPGPAGDFIDWVPGMGRTAPEVTQHPARAAETESEAETGAETAPTIVAEPSHPAPLPAPARAVILQGTVCERRHANPPELTSCRWCGAPILDGVRTVARPPLGLVEISTGGSFLLDRSAIVGRRPRASRVSGGDVPQLITVPSAQQDISRSHVALRLEGWHVLAEDLSTTNGTTLLRRGESPRRLRPAQTPVLTDGDVLDLGDGVTLRLQGRPS